MVFRVYQKLVIPLNNYKIFIYLRRSLWLFRNPRWFHKSCVFISYIPVQRAAERNSFGLLEGYLTLLAPKWPSLLLVPFKGPKKSQPPLKVSILARGHLKGAQNVSAPLKSQDFHCTLLQMGRVMGFPHKNNYIPQHLNNWYINSYICSFEISSLLIFFRVLTEPSQNFLPCDWSMFFIN